MKIVFIHNVYKRHKQVIKTIEMNRRFIDDIRTFVVSNGNYFSFINYRGIPNLTFRQLLRNRGHKVGTLDTMLYGMKIASKVESDLIIFSHDDVYINNFQLLKNNISYLDSHSIIVRKPNVPDQNYFMYDAFIIKTSVAKTIFSKKIRVNKYTLPNDFLNRPCPEIFFGNLIRKTLSNNDIKIISYDDETWGDSELGFYHIPGRDWGNGK